MGGKGRKAPSDKERELNRLMDRIERLRQRVRKDIENGNFRKAAFRVLCAEVMERYERNGKWSTEELRIKKLLNRLGFRLNEDFYHNFKIQNESQTGYYSLDFFFPKARVVLEVSPDIWHGKIGDAQKKDKRKHSWLTSLGFTVVTLDSEKLKWKDEELLSYLEKALYRRTRVLRELVELTPRTIWNCRQNHPELIVRDISDLLGLNSEEEELIRQILLMRGVNKWFFARRLLIDLKHQIKAILKENSLDGNGRKLLLQIYERLQNIAKAPRWIVFPRERKLHRVEHRVTIQPLDPKWLEAVSRPIGGTRSGG